MKKTISFVTSGLEFNGDTLKTKSLGGSESAMIYLAREMARLGNDVTVYCECDGPGIYDNVDYRHCHTFMKDDKAQMDVCIISRFTHFLANPIDSKLNVLWVHDTGVHDIELSFSRIDNVFCLSEFQKNVYHERYKVETDHFWTTTNGFDPSLVQPYIPYEQKKNNYIYSSRYERGIITLLRDIWPRILEKNPDATLHLCGYSHPSAETESEYLINYYKTAHDLIKRSSNIKDHGCLPKPDYYKLLSECAYMVYPANFPEISCINAIEAQASGCLVITSDQFALAETVKSDTKVTMTLDYTYDKSGELNQQYVEDFLKVLEQYTDELYDKETAKAKDLIQSYAWDKIAESWNQKIDSIFIDRSENNKERILDQLIFTSDIVAARDLTGDDKYQRLIDQSKLDNNIDDTYVDRGYIYTGRIRAIQESLKASIPLLNYNVSILDMGSHTGPMSKAIIDKFSFYIKKIYAYDACSQALVDLEKHLKPKFDNIETICDDVLNVANHDIDANFIIMGEILEHIEDTVDLLNRLMSLVKDKTVFAFTTPKGPWDLDEKNKPKIEHLHHFELNDIKEIFKETDIKFINPQEDTLGRRGDILGHWVYYFTVDPSNIPTFHKPDYQDKFIKTRPYKKITASMIVKNEENNLARCIKSFYNLVDDIVIVDTGSTDTTKEIARRYTDKIYDYTWEEEDGLGNFSAARNYSLSKCDGDYILWMDADEELINGKLLLQFITSDYYNSILVHQKHCIVYGDTNEYDPPYHDRLFKNNGIYFTGVVHEYPTTDNGWISKCLFQDFVFIAHYGTINRPVRDKKIQDRYYDLIQKNYKLHPDFIMAQYYYMGLLCTIVETNGDLSLVPEAVDLWRNKLIPTEDTWLLKNGLGFIQGMYRAMHANGVNLPYGTIEMRQFQNELGNTMELFATCDDEFNMYLDIKSHKKITR